MPNWLAAILVGSALALWMGYYVARKSAAKKPIQGGRAAKVLHYLGASATVAPGMMLLLGSIVFGLQFSQSLTLCLGSFALAAIFLILYAVFEVARKAA
jgi:hypothetical protein